METPLLLLHGALGSAAQMDDLIEHISVSSRAFALNFPGHGGLPLDEAFSISLFSNAVLHFMDTKGIAQADIFGYSMGGYVGLYMAWKNPGRVRQVATLGTKLDWSPATAEGMVKMFDTGKIETKAPQFAMALALAHAPSDWKLLCRYTSDFLVALGNGDGIPPNAFKEIRSPVTIFRGELDNVVSAKESMAVAESIPNGRFEILPGSKHPIEQSDLVLLSKHLREFFR